MGNMWQITRFSKKKWRNSKIFLPILSQKRMIRRRRKFKGLDYEQTVTVEKMMIPTTNVHGTSGANETSSPILNNKTNDGIEKSPAFHKINLWWKPIIYYKRCISRRPTNILTYKLGRVPTLPRGCVRAKVHDSSRKWFYLQFSYALILF